MVEGGGAVSGDTEENEDLIWSAERREMKIQGKDGSEQDKIMKQEAKEAN